MTVSRGNQGARFGRATPARVGGELTIESYIEITYGSFDSAWLGLSWRGQILRRSAHSTELGETGSNVVRSTCKATGPLQKKQQPDGQRGRHFMTEANWRLEGEWLKNCNCAFGCPCASMQGR